MHQGFRQVHENIEEMIEHVANEPSVGLFYVQQHIHNAVPHLAHIKAQVIDTTREVSIRTEDMEDAINSIKLMQECGPPIVGQMIRKLNLSLSLMSTTHQLRGQHQPVNVQSRSNLISKDSAVLSTLGSAFQTASRAAWKTHAPDFQQIDDISVIDSTNNQNHYEGREELSTTAEGASTSFVQSVFKSAFQRAGSFRWSNSKIMDGATQNDNGTLTRSSCVESQSDVNHSLSAYNISVMHESTISTVETLHAKSTDTVGAHMQNNKMDTENMLPISSASSLLSNNSVKHSENYEQFQAECAAKLEAWLSGSDEGTSSSVQEFDLKPVA